MGRTEKNNGGGCARSSAVRKAAQAEVDTLVPLFVDSESVHSVEIRPESGDACRYVSSSQLEPCNGGGPLSGQRRVGARMRL